MFCYGRLKKRQGLSVYRQHKPGCFYQRCALCWHMKMVQKVCSQGLLLILDTPTMFLLPQPNKPRVSFTAQSQHMPLKHYITSTHTRLSIRSLPAQFSSESKPRKQLYLLVLKSQCVLSKWALYMAK